MHAGRLSRSASMSLSGCEEGVGSERERGRGGMMGDELATNNVNRAYSLGGTSIAIFTFILVFLYPTLASGKINALLFQLTLAVMAVATFSFSFASLYYYGASLGSRIDDDEW